MMTLSSSNSELSIDAVSKNSEEDSDLEEKKRIATKGEGVIELSDSSSNNDSLDDEKEEEEIFIEKAEKKSKKRKINSSTNNQKSLKSTTVHHADEHEKGGKQLRRRQQVKYYQSSSSENEDTDKEEDAHTDSFSDEKDSDFDAEEYEDNKKSSKKKASTSQPLSEYEKMLEEKKAEKTELLKSLGINVAKDEYSEAISSMRARKKKSRAERPEVSRRISGRSKPTINYAEEIVNPSIADLVHNRPTEQTFQKVLNSERLCKDFIKDFKEILEPDVSIEQKPLLYDKDILENLCETAFTNRVTSPSVQTWYPSAVDLILGVGSVAGGLYLWNIKEDEYNLYTFLVHTKRVTNLQFNPSNSWQMVTSSSDGTLFCCDMQKQIFSEVFTSSRACTHFDFFSPSSSIVSLSNGQIVIIDRKTNTRGESHRQKRHTCHDSQINTINVHPVDKNYFITAGSDKTVRLWDLRKLTASPVINITCSLSKSVHSAYFSPVCGNAILTTSQDEAVRIYDCTHLTEGYIQHYKTMKCFFSGIKAKAAWLPNTDDTFAFSHKGINSQGILIYDKDFNICARVRDHIRGIRILHEFHPLRSALATTTPSTLTNSVYIHT